MYEISGWHRREIEVALGIQILGEQIAFEIDLGALDESSGQHRRRNRIGCTGRFGRTNDPHPVGGPRVEEAATSVGPGSTRRCVIEENDSC